jgi:DnaK suppressor protein
MDAARKQTIRELIVDELTEVREKISAFEKSSKALAPDKAIGRISRMDSFNDQGIHSAALSAAREKHFKLEQALSNLDQPDFGLCVSCGAAIPLERLVALPESTHCVRCTP